MQTMIRLFSGIGLLLLLLQPQRLSGQDTLSAPDCQDMVFLRDGSKLRGQIDGTKHEGNTLTFRTWNNVVLDLPRSQVRRIVQRCGKNKLLTQQPRVYDFRERGWYHHTRGGVMPGQTHTGYNTQGLFLHHSSGRMFSRMAGAGIGVGVEAFDPGGYDAATYPVFAEFRGYLLPKRITPYVSAAAGWAFSGKGNQDFWDQSSQWRGGWMAQIDIGYRIGNYFTLNCGLRLQQKKREWTSVWMPESFHGVDRILHKRLVVGIGILL